MKCPTIYVRVPPSLHKAVTKLAKDRRISINNLVMRILEKELADVNKK